MNSTATPPQPVTAIARRRIKPGHEAKFEELMQEFIGFVLRQSGHLGINVLRGSSDSREYTVLDRFASPEDRQRFTASPEYREWMQRLGAVSAACPEVQEMGGLAFWFDLPHQPPGRPPKVKMAFLTLLGVYPLSMWYPKLVAAILPGQSGWERGLVVATLIVVTLTWIVMPALSRLFERWLFPQHR
ncbi:MAG: antibiotic biosynthesis monooxygenase [Bryobacteraceae bacterium]|nr:antibiotic biosynthesis monooxygenase [Bryobacteraceae bacterium]